MISVARGLKYQLSKYSGYRQRGQATNLSLIRFLRNGVKLTGRRTNCVSLSPQHKTNRHALLSYNKGFVNNHLVLQQPFRSRHSTDWETCQIVLTLLQLGYCVDTINFKDQHFTPNKDYELFIDVYFNLARLAPLLDPACIKILHPVWAHWLFHNNANYARLASLYERRGVALLPHKLLKPNASVEHADYVISRGNAFTTDTYAFAAKPTYRITHSSSILFPWSENKNYDACRKRFLLLVGWGMVHKGVDLALEVFSTMPDFHLTVCGPLHTEQEFEHAFHQELYETPNIHTVGLADVGSSEFRELVHDCIGLLHPSCAELSSGSILTCLHAGLIVVANDASGIKISEDYGVLLKSCSLEEIRDSVKRVADLPIEKLKRMSRNAWEHAREHYIREEFAEDYRNSITDIIRTHPENSLSASC